MKKIIAISICIVLFQVHVNAQNFLIGARAGLNISNQSITSSGASVSPSSKMGYLVGAYSRVMFTDKIGLQPELLFSSVGSTWPGSLTGGSEGTFRLNYFTLPVLFHYKMNKQVYLVAGPQLGILASASAIYGGQTTDLKSDFNSSDISGVVGIGVNLNSFDAGVRYNFSLGNAASSNGTFSGATVKNTAFQIVIGYTLFEK
jgi:hypothetical protein